MHEALTTAEPWALDAATPHLGYASREIDWALTNLAKPEAGAQSFAVCAIDIAPTCLVPEIDLESGQWASCQLEVLSGEASTILHDPEIAARLAIITYSPGNALLSAFRAIDRVAEADTPLSPSMDWLWLVIAGGAMSVAATLERTQGPASFERAGAYDGTYRGHAVVTLARSRLRSEPRSFSTDAVLRFVRDKLAKTACDWIDDGRQLHPEKVNDRELHKAAGIALVGAWAARACGAEQNPRNDVAEG